MWYNESADLEWRLTYVGDAESETHDQVLDSVLVGPVYPGQYRFVFQASFLYSLETLAFSFSCTMGIPTTKTEWICSVT